MVWAENQRKQREAAELPLPAPAPPTVADSGSGGDANNDRATGRRRTSSPMAAPSWRDHPHHAEVLTAADVEQSPVLVSMTARYNARTSLRVAAAARSASGTPRSGQRRDPDLPLSSSLTRPALTRLDDLVMSDDGSIRTWR